MKLRITSTAAQAAKIAQAAKLAAAAIVIAVFAPLFSACDNRTLPEVIELELKYVRIGDLDVSVIPLPIADTDWDNEEYEVAASDYGLIIVKQTGTRGKLVTARASPAGAVVTWGTAKNGTRPVRFNDLRMPASFDEDNSDFFFFRVADPETGEIKYYRFYPKDASPVKELFNLAVAGRDPDKVPDPSTTLELLGSRIAQNAFRGTINITRAEALRGSLVAATPQDETARISFATAASPAEAIAGNFNDWEDAERVVIQDEQGKDVPQNHDVMTFTDGSVLAVRVMAENDTANFYAFQVYSERMATIASLKFDGVEITGKGAQHAQWGSVVPGSYSTADQGSGGFNINIVLDDREGSAEWGLIANTAAGQPAFTPGLSLTQRFDHEQALAIKVSSPRNSPADVRYYKVQLSLLAANFKRHPISAAYEIVSHTYELANAPGQDHNGRLLITAGDETKRTLDRKIEELSFELDRELTGTVSYQWYTANSWYGGYGFDCLSQIANDPGVIDANHGTSGHEYNHSFDEDHKDYYPDPGKFDEKGNVSFHNGGNEYYRLPYPGMKIQGATGPTYTPTIDARNRPFISGFSNQTQYYWVEITSGGLKATSKRAAIVTEWGTEFNQGRPKLDASGNWEKVPKKHHLVEPYAYLPAYSAEPGMKGNPRNAVAFKAGNHGDQYLIPITLPAGFDIMEYSVVTCNALFFLSDGRPWIQNWTQGDFGFADSDGGRLVLWYNLSSDNATRGLGSSGNEPAGGGLTQNPAQLIVQPAGTKPMKQLPEFEGKDKYGRDKPKYVAGMAQGWFTPYIEITELRFEGPSRK